MENDFEIIWTDLALEELAETVEYLKRKFTEKEVDNLGDEIERILAIISANPHIFPTSSKNQIRKAVILKFNSMYYRITGNNIQILSFFSNRKDPESKKI